eukprot:CAMPEP_0185740846 /NCGR_PEP_ID=MMETSP1171-20130828/38641_1 /TAXON_ID=374046 /ORGANISM="Helicotheca tamensis, Strain CCMP826" /LENGTH=113 /DNA_ID=CAMNT_0028412775 /DNA_START=125 /DNA_END=466 /DNA_ORIENTATION=+
MTRLLLLIAIIGFTAPSVAAFLVPSTPASLSPRIASTYRQQQKQHVLFADKRDVSRAGTKRERLDKLAELEDSRVETDKSFVLKAAGGFVAFIVVILVVALTSGVLDDVGGGY